MAAEQENVDFDADADEDVCYSSIYDSNIGLPVFPNQFKYLVESNYEILATMKTPEDVESFMTEYSNNSSTEWRVLRTYTKLSFNYVYKKAFRCQYNVQQRQKNLVRDINRIKVSKDCNCPGYICISLHRTSAKRGSENSELYKDFTARIKINLDHNHALKTKAALRNRSLDPTIKDKIEGMFQYGHGASAAIKLHLLDLLMINEEHYFNLIHDGKYRPTVSQVQHYLNNLKKDLELLDLKDVIREYLDSNSEAQVQYFCIQSEANKVITIITDLMMKVHQHIPRSGQVISISLSFKLNRVNTKLLTISTHSEIGPLPLGLIILQQNEEAITGPKFNVIREALNKFCEHTSSNNYFYGQSYPRVILTDNELVPSVSAVWTQSLVLVSQSSVLKNVWMWLQEAPNGVHFAEREGFYYSFKRIMKSINSDQCQKCINDLVQYTETAPSYLKFVESLMIYQHLWMDHHRSEKMKQLQLAHIQLEPPENLGVEIISSYVYSQLLTKIKNLFYTLPEMLNFVLNHLETYYYIRMMKLVNQNIPKSMLSKYLETDEQPQDFTLQTSDYDQDCYFVLSSDVYHYVDYKQRLCSSNTKKSALTPCSHINAVLNHKTMENTTIDQSIQDMCRLFVNEQYSNLCVDEHSIIVINKSESRRWSTKMSFEYTSKPHGEDILGDSQLFDVSQTSSDENESFVPIEDNVEYVTLNVTDFKMETSDDENVQRDLEESEKPHQDKEHDNICEKVIELDQQAAGHDSSYHQTNQIDIKQEPPDYKNLVKITLKRKLDACDNIKNIEGVPPSQSISAPIMGRGARLVRLKQIVQQFPEESNRAVFQKRGTGIQNAIFLQTKAQTSLEDQDVRDISQESVVSVNENVRAAPQIPHAIINQDSVLLLKPQVVENTRPQRVSAYSMSDNVIIIDSNVKKVPNAIHSKVKKTIEVDSDEKKFDDICAIIKQNPSQYKTVIRNMIDVYETFYGES